MRETAAHGSEKTPRRRQFCLLLLLMGILMLFYNSSFHPSQALKTLTTYSWLSSSQRNVSAENSVLTDNSKYYVEYPHPYSFIIDEPHRCEKESPFLVLMIPVAPHDRKARDVIRNTWAKQTRVLGKVVSHYFLLGTTNERNETAANESLEQQVLEESQQHHDIIQSDFLDSYKNLTIKTMVMLEWLSSHCPNSFYAMKIDSDIFLNVPNLVDMLLDAPRQLYMTGLVVTKAYIVRLSTSKWFMPYSMFPEPIYPPYTMGLGYVFSMDLPKEIIEASTHVKAIYIEDVYVGLCMKHLGIPLSDPPYGLFRANVPYFMARCYWTTVITTIMRDSDHLLETWTKYQHQLTYC